MQKNSFDKNKLVGYEIRCDKCGVFLPFNEQTIERHYNEKHAGVKSNWRKHTDFESIMSLRNSDGFAKFEFARNAGIQDITTTKIEDDSELSFIAPELIARARSFADALGARLYKFTSLADGHAYKMLDLGNGKVVNFDYFISEDERKRAARSMFDKDINLNHYLYSPYFNFVVDAEDVNGKLVALILIEDPLYNQLYDSGLVTGNSVEYYRRNSQCSCTGNCTCEDTGVIYVGWALVSAPANPADADGEVIQRNFAEVMPSEHNRIVSLVQANVKANITKFSKHDYSYQRASENDNGKTNTNTSGITANGSTCGCNLAKTENGRQVAANVSAENNSAQPGNTIDAKSSGSKTHGESRESNDVNLRRTSAGSFGNAEDTTSPKNEVINEMLTDTQITELVNKTVNEALTKQKTEFETMISSKLESFTKSLAKTSDETAKNNDKVSNMQDIADKLAKSFEQFKNEMISKHEELKKTIAVGHGRRQPDGSTMFTKDEYASMLPAKIENASLEEIVKFVENGGS